ncbi:MAG: AraC family transcriptional regulator N-terminal domain-containing protein [Bacteroidia bacterium]|nr:AraC family transcriptional regulator N-terminal domain-containing protein [Bacteroidia bacterium]
MAKNKVTPILPELTHEHSLKTLVENRTIYNLENCELNLFETYERSIQVPLKFNDLVVTSMLRGKKVMHLFDDPAFDYLPGESVIIPANELMRIDFPEATLDKPTQCLALAIDNQKILNTLDLLNEKYPKEGRKDFWKLDELNYFFYNNDELAQTINKIINICRSTDISKDALADLALQELLVRIIQTQTLNQLESNKSLSTNTYLTNIVSMIQSGLTDKLNLKILAQSAGMSTASLYRLFKRELGISPVEYIILERIKLAKKLLKNQDVYIKNVSYETGFDDCNYFIRTFKYYEGITPKQYQILNGKN